MSSELLGSAQNVLKGNLGGAWDITNGYQDAYTDLGIARRFGGASAAYSLRDIGAMNGPVVRVRRDVDGQGSDPEEDFSANQVSSGALEDWVNGKLENTLPADVATAAAAYSLRKVKADYTGYAVRIRRTVDDAEVNVAFDSEDKVSASSTILKITGATNATTLGEFLTEDSVNYNAFVHTWYDQAGSNNAVQSTSANQPQIADTGVLLADGIDFDGSNDLLQTSTQVLTGTETGANSMYAVIKQTSGDAGYICGSAATSVGADQIGQSLYGNNNGSYFALSNGNNIDNPERDNITITQGSTVLVSANYSNNNTNTLNKNANSNGYSNGTEAYDFNAGSKFTIGARDGSTATAVLFDGSMQEIIAYDSDQTNNRFKIESNINNYYGLYTFQGDGFVETWYDQSGSGNDATQTTASEQPLIVQNGGIVKNSKGKPSLDFIPSSDHLEVPTVIDNINTVSAFFVFERDVNSGNGAVAGQLGSDSASSRFYTPIFTGSTMYFGYGDSATKINMGSYDANRTYLASFVTGDTNAEAFLDNVSKGTTAIQSSAIDTTSGAIGRNVRTSSSFPWDGQVSEVIYYKAKLQDDVADLNTDINNHYNIY